MIGFFNASSVFSLPTLNILSQQANSMYMPENNTPLDPVPTADIYYFAEDGNDLTGVKNNKNLPFKTLDKVKDLIPTLNAGDGILFAMGDTFRYTYSDAVYEYEGYHTSMVDGTELNPIVFSRYWKTDDEAETQLPILTGDTTFTLTFTQQADIAGEPKNIWMATGATRGGIRILRDGVEIGNCETFDEFEDNPEQLMWNQTDEMWFKSDETKAQLDASVWTYSDQKYIFNIEYTKHVIFNGLDTRWTRGGGADISMWQTTNILVQNCNIGFYSSGGLNLTGNHITLGVGYEVLHNTFDTGWRVDFSFDYISSSEGVGLHNQLNLSSYADNCVVEYNNFIDFGHVAVSFPYADGIQGGRWNHNYFDAPNSAYARPFGGVDGGFDGLEIAYNIVNRCSTQSQVQGTNVHWHHNIFSNWFMSNKSVHLTSTNMLQNDSVPIQGKADGHIIENNIFYNNEMQGIKIYDNPAYAGNVRNNIFYNCGTNLSDANSRGMSLTFFGWQDGDDSDTLVRTSNNNLFFDDTVSNYEVFAIGTQQTDPEVPVVPTIWYKLTVTELNAVVWESNNNIEADPEFIDTSDFRIASTSAANDGGIASTEFPMNDYDGIAITSPYNIGLYNTEV